jgi:hypothetical protein
MEGKQIYQLIPQVMRGIGAIGKGRNNAQQNYKFRGIDDVYNAVQPVLVEHGVFVVPTVVEQAREERTTRSGANMIYTVLTVKHTFYAPDGSSIEAVTVGEAMDSGDKSANKAMSAAMKYALIEVFSIPTEGDNDTENNSPEVAPKKQPAPAADNGSGVKPFKAALAKAFSARGFSRDEMVTATPAILKAFNVERIEDLTADQRQMLLRGVTEGAADKFKLEAVA